MSAQIVCDTQDHVALIQLQRPEKKNALSTAMYAALADAFAAAQADASVRVILIQGSATCFTAGNDLQDFLQQPPAGESAPVRLTVTDNGSGISPAQQQHVMQRWAR